MTDIARTLASVKLRTFVATTAVTQVTKIVGLIKMKGRERKRGGKESPINQFALSTSIDGIFNIRVSPKMNLFIVCCNSCVPVLFCPVPIYPLVSTCVTWVCALVVTVF